jgi:hypothetical protein
MSLLNQPDAVGIRVYFGFDAKKNLEMVLVGVDSNENDLVYVRNVCIETGVSTPPHSSVPNILNS